MYTNFQILAFLQKAPHEQFLPIKRAARLSKTIYRIKQDLTTFLKKPYV